MRRLCSAISKRHTVDKNKFDLMESYSDHVTQCDYVDMTYYEIFVLEQAGTSDGVTFKFP